MGSNLLKLICEEPVAPAHEKNRKVVRLTIFHTPDRKWVSAVVDRFVSILQKCSGERISADDFQFTWEYRENGVVSKYVDIIINEIGGLGKTARFAGVDVAGHNPYAAVPCISINSAVVGELVDGDSDLQGYILDRVHLLPLTDEEVDMPPADALDSYWRRKCDPYDLIPGVYPGGRAQEIVDTEGINLAMARAVSSIKAEGKL